MTWPIASRAARSRPPRSHAVRRLVGAVLLPLMCAALLPAGARAADPVSTSRVDTTSDGLADLPALAPTKACSDVQDFDLSGVTGAPVTITSTSVITEGTPAPYCEVTGTIAPNNTIVLRLPMQGWTQRYVQTGCGGLCGSSEINYTQASGCPVVEDGTVASATTDMGHQGQNDGSWAAGNPQAVIDFAYRGVHVTAQVAKAVITRFYGRAPVYSYFDGCSDGGREALMEAQRYPHDFDGIAAGAPASNFAVQNTFHHAWNVLANKDANGDFILLADKLPVLHAAVLEACDGTDGLEDGVIDDPRRCHFHPASIVCRPSQATTSCLTPAEAQVVRRLHDGAVDSKGRRLEPAIAHEWGSELDWTLFVPRTQGETSFSENIALSALRYLVDPDHQDPAYELTDLKFTVRSFWRMVQSSSYMSALDPDLRRYQRSGGKLLLWHGWSDQHISPQSTLAYYDAMRRSMGARNVDRFAKLYLFPGMAHCGGGEGPNTFDILTPVMAWVESGRRPGRIVASTVVADGSTTRTRPVFPYPTVARYDGSGSTDQASNFQPFTPTRRTGPGYRWVGQKLYSSDYQTWCRVVDGKLVCTPHKTWLTHKVNGSHA